MQCCRFFMPRSIFCKDAAYIGERKAAEPYRLDVALFYEGYDLFEIGVSREITVENDNSAGFAGIVVTVATIRDSRYTQVAGAAADEAVIKTGKSHMAFFYQKDFGIRRCQSICYALVGRDE